jgi:predicted Holliday junction resolvase-like endonuclease
MVVVVAAQIIVHLGRTVRLVVAQTTSQRRQSVFLVKATTEEHQTARARAVAVAVQLVLAETAQAQLAELVEPQPLTVTREAVSRIRAVVVAVR